MTTDVTCWVVLVAAGKGTRLAAEVPKPYVPIDGRPLISYSLDCFLSYPPCVGIVVVIAEDDERWSLLPYADMANVYCVRGGKERYDSVLHGLQFLRDKVNADSWVMVHDAARPCITPALLDRLLQTLQNDAVGGLLGIPVTDTVKRIDNNHNVVSTIDREDLCLAQTPQLYRYDVLSNAMTSALEAGVAITDSSMAVAQAGYPCTVVEGDVRNLKVTVPADIALATYYIRER